MSPSRLMRRACALVGVVVLIFAISGAFGPVQADTGPPPSPPVDEGPGPSLGAMELGRQVAFLVFVLGSILLWLAVFRRREVRVHRYTRIAWASSLAVGGLIGAIVGLSVWSFVTSPFAGGRADPGDLELSVSIGLAVAVYVAAMAVNLYALLVSLRQPGLWTTVASVILAPILALALYGVVDTVLSALL